MIYKGKYEIASLKTPRTASGLIYTVQGIYRRGAALYQAIQSCFGSGVWINDKAWVNDEAWKS